jgi:hypothetical protein
MLEMGVVSSGRGPRMATSGVYVSSQPWIGLPVEGHAIGERVAHAARVISMAKRAPSPAASLSMSCPMFSSHHAQYDPGNNLCVRQRRSTSSVGGTSLVSGCILGRRSALGSKRLIPWTLGIGRRRRVMNVAYSDTTPLVVGAPKKDGWVSRATQRAFQNAAWRYKAVLR